MELLRTPEEELHCDLLAIHAVIERDQRYEIISSMVKEALKKSQRWMEKRKHLEE